MFYLHNISAEVALKRAQKKPCEGTLSLLNLCVILKTTTNWSTIKTSITKILPTHGAMKQSILIIGSGWAGSTLATSLDETKYSITVISPETTTLYTPLLASAAYGLYDFNIVATPVRHTSKNIKFIKARVESIHFEAKKVQYTPAFSHIPIEKFSLSYDIVIICPGVGPHLLAS